MPYFRSSYNTTFISERAVELPFFLKLIKNYDYNFIEIGNVLSHYKSATWPIIDKYEHGNGVTNCDAEDFNPIEKKSLVISISTFEHIGFDETIKDELKVKRIIKKIIDNWLTNNGSLWFSIPVGWNPIFDRMLYNREIFYTNIFYMQRVNNLNEWEEIFTPSLEWLLRPYKMFATGLIIVQINK